MANTDSVTRLYNGRHTASFRNSTHRYYIDGKLKPGVTTIMSKVLAKEGLMLWPLNMAIQFLEQIVPGVVLSEDLEDAKKAYIKRRDAGADVGTIVHEAVEKILQGEEVGSLTGEALLAVNAFRAWQKKVNPEVIAVEKVVYSAEDDYAGTFDSILKIDDKVYLTDLKTTNASRSAPEGIYAENFIQLGAYWSAYEEQRLFELHHDNVTELVPIDDLLILSCKKNGQVHTRKASEFGLSTLDCAEMWRCTQSLHKDLQALKDKLGSK